MHIFMFKSDAKGELNAFAGDPQGSKLPPQHGPWQATGVIRPDKEPPHKFSRMSYSDNFAYTRRGAWTH